LIPLSGINGGTSSCLGTALGVSCPSLAHQSCSWLPCIRSPCFFLVCTYACRYSGVGVVLAGGALFAFAPVWLRFRWCPGSRLRFIASGLFFRRLLFFLWSCRCILSLFPGSTALSNRPWFAHHSNSWHFSCMRMLVAHSCPMLTHLKPTHVLCSALISLVSLLYHALMHHVYLLHRCSRYT
jgi:hypothetical protein